MLKLFERFVFPHNKFTIKILNAIEHLDFEEGGARVPAILILAAKNRIRATTYMQVKEVINNLEKLKYVERFYRTLISGMKDVHTIYYRLTPEGRAFLTSKEPKFVLEIGQHYITGAGSVVQVTHLTTVEPASYRGDNGLSYGSDGQYVGRIDQDARSLVRRYKKP